MLDDGFYRLLLTVPATLGAAFDLLPDEWFDRYPRHRMSRSLARAAGSHQLVDEEAFDDFARWVEGQRAPATRDLLGIETTHLRRMLAVQNFTGARAQADGIRDMITRAADTRGFHDVLPAVLLRVARVYVQVGDLPAAADSLVVARRFAVGFGDSHPFEPYVRSHLALVDALQDRFVDARSRLGPLGAAAEPRASSLGGQLQDADLLVRALIEVSSGTRQSAEEALGRIDDDSLSDLWWIRALARARASAQWGVPRDGIAMVSRDLRDHSSAAGPELLAGQLLGAELATLYQLDGDLRAADSVLAAIDLDGAAFALRVARARGFLMRGEIRAGERLMLEGPPADLGSAPAVTLLLAAQGLQAGTVPPESIARAVAALQSDAAAYAVQQLGPRMSEQVLRAAFPGRARFRSAFRYPRQASRADLSDREREVLAALRRYSHSRDIAAHLHVSVNTIKTHRRNLYAKLGVNDRAEAIAAADRMGGDGARSRG